MASHHSVAILILWLLLASPWIAFFTEVEDYMDEIFHVPQTQKYCEGNFRDWDPKITTFPGLYLLAALPANILRHLPIDKSTEILLPILRCSTTYLRGVNVLHALGCCLLFQRLFARRMDEASASKHALVLALYPIHFFYTFLCYTDVSSVFWVLLTLHLALPTPRSGLPSQRRLIMSGITSFVAVGIRQTNAVWVMFIFGVVALDDLQRSKTFGSDLKGPLGINLIFNFVRSLLLDLRRLLLRYWPLLLAPIAFVAFVLKNGSIVVGDHSNHQAVLHWAQLAYLAVVVAAVWGPVGRNSACHPSRLKAFLGQRLGSPKAVVVTLAATAAVAYLLHRFSLAHPFLLADNRHYTFYIWNRFLGRIPGLKEALAPVYLYCAWLLYDRLATAQSPLWCLIFLVAIALTLVPAHLLEPRYFTTAVLIAHANGPEQSNTALFVVGITSLLVNVITLYIFVFKPFEWPGGEVARFMW